MATSVLKCDGTDPLAKPDWDEVVGFKTLADGGRVGDLLEITRAHIEDAKQKGELTEAASGEAYSQAIMEAMKNAIAFELEYPKSQLELCFLQAQIDKLKCDCENDTARTNSQIDLNKQQIEKLKCDCKNDTDKTDSAISLNAAQENKLACDCCNTSAITSADIQLRMQQIEKSKCDCSNSTKIADKQAALYKRQADGFDDNANQKLYDSQLSAWSMVFGDAELPGVTPSIEDSKITSTYTRLNDRLEGSAI